ncbi:hypothetical protein EHI8A_153200 [Entamoeba histolytica HM-1:IMSS-B]|uniref:Uncharacterized protein n=5 Tax=Entamoeba histolytica TaxID=5759 RepID=C4M3N4_ENTH1|nr:hypothetical protein EHI_140620 [Entamoeba histolytica HM-1:IMSS]EMH74461.1 hypothetical protein EHI8A_153200 [Entamoeba histolytica HM-1:IMSS-B]EMS16430.1 hypothetical protein KM1_227930 [Entamoeba histolytica HM-3:IMSS]ENY65198.1 hypothetical protein EHI7A_137730 [Entamoeba histolytica HM-1:IMSS-A]GAT95936.1 hypothetical protein CL6EHI_140620 [Entamoeba histolytica]EAL48823.1 hypothetical protein EHI_140620 [Entamoeba histolytica HM-1:IMSS]|eukprot:XP_654212.1 hypothetical protein EHI_140620 [Entamoeba histolytica HM-1:IMSS]
MQVIVVDKVMKSFQLVTENKQNQFINSKSLTFRRDTALSIQNKTDKLQLANEECYKPKQQNIKSQQMTEKSVSKINKLFYIQKINRIKDWILSKHPSALYPEPYLLK